MSGSHPREWRGDDKMAGVEFFEVPLTMPSQRQAVTFYRHRGKKSLVFKHPLVMGVLNVTPDSFFDGGRYPTIAKAVIQGRKLLAEGADIIDIGGESTRPGAIPVSASEEIKRVTPVIEKLLASEPTCVISIDTYKPEVADDAIRAGATIINDICGMQKRAMRRVAARHQTPVVIMHMKGRPGAMPQNPRYKNVVEEIITFFRERVEQCKKEGVEKIILDPGVGFGKSPKHNLEIIRRVGDFRTLGFPLLIGASRKSFIGATLGLPLGERGEADLAVTALAISGGANIVRVHDVAANRKAAFMAAAIRDGGS